MFNIQDIFYHINVKWEYDIYTSLSFSFNLYIRTIIGREEKG